MKTWPSRPRAATVTAAVFLVIALSSTVAASSPAGTPAASRPPGVVTRARYLMGTICEITADPSQIDAAFDEGARVESFLSTWRGGSELSRLNARHEATVSPELAALLANAVAWNGRTGNTFNPLVAPLIDAWKTRNSGAVPDERTLAAALARTSPANAVIDGAHVTLRNDAAFEEGAFGKGYALDRMMARLTAPEAVLNFGGQLLVRGSIPVTIADPEHRDRPVVAFVLRDASLSTSSGSEKTFTAGGQRFTHIIDPRDGRALPPRGSASVICDDAFTADVLSTALYVMGPDAGLQWAEAHRVAALFIGPGVIRTSSAFRSRAKELRSEDAHFRKKD